MSAAVAASSHAVPIAASAPPPGGSACSAQIHDALKADLTTWRALPLDSYWGHGPTLYEMRRCPRCGSSLMQRIEIIEARYPDQRAG